MRIKKGDLILLDELAKVSGKPRSVLINNLLHSILLTDLMSIEEIDARLLVAKAADDDANYDVLARHWSFEALMPEIRFMFDNIMAHGRAEEMPPIEGAPEDYDEHSEAFRVLRQRLDRRSK